MKSFTAPFIKSRTPFDASAHASFAAPLFRRKFTVDHTGQATLQICALAYGYCYINGQLITEDLLTAPVSEYDKLVWYNQYDVSALLKEGDNCIAVILGNGFFNENFPTTWHTSEAPWRDVPKVALSLSIDGETVLESDENFVYTEKSFVTYNQLRSGETFDARLYDPTWKSLEFDDTGFNHAILDDRMDKVERALCMCEPIREMEEYDFVSAQKTEEGYLLDFGVNMSGYLRICVDEAPGTVIEMRHAEEAYPDGRLRLNRLDLFHKNVDFQVNRYICGEQNYTWSPKFTYHGFRFVLIKGLTKPPKRGTIKAVFIHQAIPRKADFRCSNELINKIYNAGIRSTYSNLHYALTDCPSREKLGWMNDAQSSFSQIYINFSIVPFMDKWEKDIFANVHPNGQVDAVIPAFFLNSSIWGPVADGFLFELPYIEYLYTGDAQKLIRFLPYMEKYYTYFTGDAVDESGWLGDWDGHDNHRLDDFRFVRLFYQIKFCKILTLAHRLNGSSCKEPYEQHIQQALDVFKNEYLDGDGKSVLDSQTAIAMLLSLKAFDAKPLIEQLKKRVQADDYHLTSGMLGLQYIYSALFENDAAEYAYRLITVKGQPSYSFWFENDATTLWESWQEGHTDSRNHHMLSGVLTWFTQGLLGIAPDIEHPGYREIRLTPAFVEQLDYCAGYVETPYGRIDASWRRDGEALVYSVTIPEGVRATFRDEPLKAGENTFRMAVAS